MEIAPVGGYRFGGDFFELAMGRPVDLDGAPVVGGAINVPLADGLSIEGVFTHQHAHVAVSGGAFNSPAQAQVVVDHWLAGGRQEFGSGRARPFLSGLLGLTRYGVEGDTEVRFTVGAGGGVKLAFGRWIGLRLESRVFTTFVDAQARAAACAPGICLIGVNVNAVWQAEFAAGLIVAF